MKSHRLIFAKQFVAILTILTISSFSVNTFAADPLPTYTEPTTGMELIFISGGDFTMGINTLSDLRLSHLRPSHTVNVQSFYMGKYEVTFNEYDLFCNETGRTLPKDDGWGRNNRPVINVNWIEATEFAVWLSQKTGKTFRLPSESEWEYAARGGGTSIYPWGDNVGTNNASCRHCGSPFDYDKTAPVGTFAPNSYGLYDTSGNVYEWVLDHEHRTYIDAPTDGSAWTINGASSSRMTRSGSWREPVIEITNYSRCWEKVESRSNEFGFRLLMEP